MRAGALGYYGGKSPGRALTKWIADNLPWEYRSTYIEPFAGMCGVLLTRQRVHTEIINDRNDRLVNWWTVVRDHADEFGRQLEETHQHSRTEYNRCIEDLDCEDPIRRAVAFNVVVNTSILHTDTERGSWIWRDRFVGGKLSSWCANDIAKIRDRTRMVQIENTDAVELLERMHDKPHAVIYVDPPYRTANHSPYSFVPDWDALTAVLLKQQGSVAVSGYNDEWDHLGWRCEGVWHPRQRMGCEFKEDGSN